jgi:hypothetical protein
VLTGHLGGALLKAEVAISSSSCAGSWSISIDPLPMRVHDLEGIVTKRLDDSYDSRVRWFKIKNPGHSQKEG